MIAKTTALLPSNKTILLFKCQKATSCEFSIESKSKYEVPGLLLLGLVVIDKGDQMYPREKPL